MRGLLGHSLLLLSRSRTSTSLSSLLKPPKPSLLPLPAPPTLPPSPFSSTPRPLKESSARLTPEELAEINLLIPRLCESNRIQEAVRLIDTCLLTNSSLQSLPLTILITRLCSDGPDMAHAMSLLTALNHNPLCRPHSLTAICLMLITSYFKNRRPKEAMKVFNWMGRPNPPCPPDPEVNRIVIGGLCRHGMVLEALRVLRQIIVGSASEVVPATEVRAWVYRSLLREARVREAQELDKALGRMAEGAGNEAREGVVEVLDQMIAVWKE